MRYLYFILILCLFQSCNNSNNNSHKTISKLIGKEINIPENLDFQINGTIIDPELFSSDYTIITYIDSAGCTTCKMNLDLWKEALNDLISAYGVEVDFIMILNSAETDDINNSIKQHDFHFPVVYDYKGEFECINSLPKNDIFHTFLVDGEYRIMAVGNPSINPKILELYRNIIYDGNIYQEKHLCRKRVKTIGVLSPQDSVNITFNFVNSDSTEYHVQSIRPSCDCIRINTSTSTIRPGKTEEMKISFKPDSTHARIHKSIDVFFNEKSDPETIVVLGYLNKLNH